MSSVSSKQDLVAVSPEQLHVGAVLRFTLRDEKGRVLLAKGLRIENLEALDTLQSRKAVYVNYEESDEAFKVLMDGLNEVKRRDAPLKDIDRYVSLKTEEVAVALSFALPQAWSEVEARLKITLGQIAQGGNTAKDALHRLEDLIKAMHDNLLGRDREAALFLLTHRAVTGFTGYSVSHALLAATVVQVLSTPLKLTAAENAALVRAALTMNVSMTALQDQLATQKTPPTEPQRQQIDRHATESVLLLQAAGVTDPLWLGVVEIHHAPLPAHMPLAQQTSPQRLAKILQVVDRYTAAMSPRVSRPGRDAKEAARSAIVQTKEAKPDEVGLMLLQVLGLHPPGTFVTMANGETGVVLLKGSKPNEPWVASVLNKRGEPIAEPGLRHAAKPEWAVVHSVSASHVKVRLSPEVMLRQLAHAKAGAERHARAA